MCRVAFSPVVPVVLKFTWAATLAPPMVNSSTSPRGWAAVSTGVSCGADPDWAERLMKSY